MIRVLPESYRRSDTLEVASHVVVIPRVAPFNTLFAGCRSTIANLPAIAPAK
jgi:hypothetical protein